MNSRSDDAEASQTRSRTGKFAIAAESRYPKARKRSKKVAKEMTPHEIALGDMYARQFFKKRKND